MSKQELIMRFSTIFNRGIATEEETKIFEGMSHEQLVETFINYINLHSDLLGTVHIESSQALNDHGVDIIVTINEECKIGIQIKSPFDVSEDNFAQNVKRQLTESFAHNLDKWYLFICSPLITNTGINYTQRINHLINELSLYNTNYHCVFGPLSSAQIIKYQTTKMPENDFNLIVKRYLKQDEPDEITYVPQSYKASNSLSKINSVLGWNHSEDELKITKEYFDQLLQTLTLLPKKTRQIFTETLKRSERRLPYQTIQTNLRTPLYEVETCLRIDRTNLIEEINLLNKYGLAYIEEDEGILYICITDGNADWDIIYTISLAP
ncbi:MAG: hypothetical protein CW346_01315 [Bacillaceae bacterium]|nr:hypothetical protein [Bacillaceae bacterium]